MRNFKSLISLTFFSIFMLLYACSSSSEEKSETIVQALEASVSSKVYTVKGVPSIKWTAYKFTDKVGVNGTFNKVTYESVSKKGIARQLLENTSFTIETESVNSNLKFRDERIYTYFFSKIGAKTITGKFTVVANSGGEISIAIGEINRSVPFTYAISSDKINISVSLNLVLWKASSGITKLNEMCKGVHTGADGISKLWPDVDVVVEITLE